MDKKKQQQTISKEKEKPHKQKFKKKIEKYDAKLKYLQKGSGIEKLRHAMEQAKFTLTEDTINMLTTQNKIIYKYIK